jgi:hypothetical protein
MAKLSKLIIICMTIKNPFQHEENLKPWFDQFAGYKSSFETSKQSYKEKVNIKNPNLIIMTIQNTINYFTKHAVVASLLLFISLGSVGAVAAELTLPEQYKPSTQIKNLFASNTQPDTDPYTRLVYDGDNDVVSLDRCDLAVKYPKKVGDLKIISSATNYLSSSNPSLNISNLNTLGELSIQDEKKYYWDESKLHNLNIKCYEGVTNNILDLLTFAPKMDYEGFETLSPQEKLNSITNAYSKYENREFKQETINTKELREKFGWFVTESELTNIKIYSATRELNPYTRQKVFSSDNNGKLDFEYTGEDKVILEVDYHITFEKNNKTFYFFITESSANVSKKLIAGKDFQLQFNSVAKNEPNTKINQALVPELKLVNQDKLEIQNPASDSTKTQITSYILPTDPNDINKNGYMNIVNSKQVKGEKDQKYLSAFLKFLYREASLEEIDKYIELDEEESGPRSSTEKLTLLFSGDKASPESTFVQYIQDHDQIKYEGMEKIRAYSFFQQASVIPGISVSIMAERGNDIILVTKYVDLSIFEDNYETGNYELYDIINKGCSFEELGYKIDYTDPAVTEGRSKEVDEASNKSLECRKKNVIKNDRIQAQINKSFAELTQTFALKE